MLLLQTSTAGNGPDTQLPPGKYKISADVAAGGTVTFQEKDTAAGQYRSIFDPNGVAYSFTTPGGSFVYTAAGWNYVRAVLAGAFAVTVRAEPVPEC